MCDNMDIETIPEYVFKADSGLMKCEEKSKLLVSRNYASGSSMQIIKPNVFLTMSAITDSVQSTTAHPDTTSQKG